MGKSIKVHYRKKTMKKHKSSGKNMRVKIQKGNLLKRRRVDECLVNPVSN